MWTRELCVRHKGLLDLSLSLSLNLSLCAFAPLREIKAAHSKLLQGVINSFSTPSRRPVWSSSKI